MKVDSPKICIVILNYNGEELLPQCLPSLSQAVKSSKYPVRVVILDNLSTDQGLQYVTQKFPEFEIYHAKENRILCSYNDYLPLIQETIVILLNNDIRVDPDFIDPLIEKFLEDQDCFLVAPKVLSFDGTRIEAGRSKSGIRFGFFWCDARYPGYEKEVDQFSETASSGFGAFSRKKFLELEGYDSRFSPGIMEDVDLCLRAARKGHHLFYQPKSLVYHMGQASFKKRFGVSETAIIAHRNNFLFMWKNFNTPGFWILHLFFLPWRLLYALLRGNFSMLIGFKRALCKE